MWISYSFSKSIISLFQLIVIKWELNDFLNTIMFSPLIAIPISSISCISNMELFSSECEDKPRVLFKKPDSLLVSPDFCSVTT